jgi:hypothetical protein
VDVLHAAAELVGQVTAGQMNVSVGVGLEGTWPMPPSGPFVTMRTLSAPSHANTRTCEGDHVAHTAAATPDDPIRAIVLVPRRLPGRTLRIGTLALIN